jgi:putative endonuclease
MAENIVIGKFGEDIATDYLRDAGFRILKRNYKLGSIGEIDIICRDIDGTLVFVEVKSGVSFSEDIKPEHHFNKDKEWRVRRLAENFANSHPNYVSKKLGFRIDLITVSFSEKGGSPNSNLKDWTIRHYKNF